MVLRLSPEAAQHAVEPTYWHVEGATLHATFATGSFLRGVEFVQAVAEAAEAANHHPDVDLRYPTVHLVLTTHDAGGLTPKDVELAGAITTIAERMGIHAAPSENPRGEP